MSFNNNRFDRFSPIDPESRLQDFRKRFENLSQNPNQMFESKIGNRWPTDRFNNHPMSKNLSQSPKRSDTEEDGIPIKVIHEMSDDTPNGELNGHQKRESMSSSQSQRSSDTSHSSGSSGSVFHSDPRESRGQPSGQPRVHHIPITVEPREGSTSSGYTSEGNATFQQPLSRSSSHSSANSGSTGHTLTKNRSPSPAKSVSSEHSNASSGGNRSVRQIPVTIESKQKSNASPKVNSNPPKSEQFVTRILVSPQMDSPSQTPNESVVPKAKSNSMETINNILSDLKKYETEINQFKGTANDKKYKYLDEMMTRFMIKLDTIETDGNEDLRKARKEAVIAVNKYITLLESKVFDKNNNRTNDKESSLEPMDMSVTPEPTHDESQPQKMTTETMDSQRPTNVAADTQVCDQNVIQNHTSLPNCQRKETAV